MQQPSKSIFLTVEGIEGVGKSTAMHFIQTLLTQAKKKHILTREPGGTIIAEEIRKILLRPANEVMQPETELLLMFASRFQHVADVIEPALKAGLWVVSDRFVDASFAYQGGGRRIALTRIAELEKWLPNHIVPDRTLLLDAPPEVGLARAKHRGPHDRIEQEKMEFFERVRSTYLERAKKDPKRFRIIDASEPLESVQGEITKALHELF